MKKFRFMLVALLMCVATGASAQFANSSKGGSTSSSWQGFRFSYLPMSIEDLDMTGLSLGYVKSFGVAKQIPLFLEVGGNLLYGFDDTEGVKTKVMAVNIPVNFGYKYDFNEKVSIYPHIGLNFRVNAMGKMEYEDEDIDFFDDLDAKRFNVGFNVGVNCHISNFMVGVGYETDFTEYMEECKVSSPVISVGFNF